VLTESIVDRIDPLDLTNTFHKYVLLVQQYHGHTPTQDIIYNISVLLYHKGE